MNGPGTQKVERDLKKLPKWARFRIEKAEEDVKFYKDMAENLQAGLLERGEYEIDQDHSFRVHLQGDDQGPYLAVYGDMNTILVEPRSSNVVWIRHKIRGQTVAQG
jgi:hypothetical protein